MQRRREGTVVHGEFEDDGIELFGQRARTYVIDQQVEGLSREHSGPTHSLERFRPVNPYLAAGPARAGEFQIQHTRCLLSP